jgi:hypothetical protein
MSSRMRAASSIGALGLVLLVLAAHGRPAAAATVFSISGTVGGQGQYYASFGGDLYLYARPFGGDTGPYGPNPPWAPTGGGIYGPYGTFGLPPITYRYSFVTSAVIDGATVNDSYAVNQYEYVFVPGGYDVLPGAQFYDSGEQIIPQRSAHAISFTDIHYNYQTWADGGDSVLYTLVWALGADMIVNLGPGQDGRAFTLTVSTVPEPAEWAAMLVGFALVGAALRSRPNRFGAA